MDAILLEIPARYDNGEIWATQKSNVFKLNPPIFCEQYNPDTDTDETLVIEYIIASDNEGQPFISRSETLLFPADENGVLLDWLECGGGYTHTIESAIESIGYTIVK